MKKRTITTRQLTDAIRRDDGTGFCVACGHKAPMFVEPDAECYPCPNCKEPAVFGAEQILLRRGC